jgi:2-dehydropantoate 2-reductase
MNLASFPRIAIVGSGAIGGLYGALLARAGHDVRFLLRSDLEQVRRSGLRIDLPRGEGFTLPDVQAYGATADIGPVDLVLVGLKATANDALSAMLKPLLHEHTLVVNLQNGLGVDEPVVAAAGVARSAGGLCFVCSNRIAPGHISCTLTGMLAFANVERPADDRLRAVANLFADTPIKTTTHDSLTEARWRKLVWNIPFNGLAIAAGGLTTSELLASPTLTDELRALMQEVLQGARSQGVEIPANVVESNIDQTRRMEGYKPSSLIDYLAGNPVEVEPIWGEPLRRARAAGVELPRLALLYALLRQLAAGRD